jgi:hypothetical protein
MEVNKPSLYSNLASLFVAKTRPESPKPFRSSGQDSFVSTIKVGQTLAADDSSKHIPVNKAGPELSKLLQDAANFYSAA